MVQVLPRAIQCGFKKIVYIPEGIVDLSECDDTVVCGDSSWLKVRPLRSACPTSPREVTLTL